MEQNEVLKILNESFSLTEAALKLFGKSDYRSREKSKKIM